METSLDGDLSLSLSLSLSLVLRFLNITESLAQRGKRGERSREEKMRRAVHARLIRRACA
jgi:hypothetical protein